MGPLLFLIYINDINVEIYNSQLLLYADNLVLYRAVDRVAALGKNVISIFQSDLDIIHKWCFILSEHCQPPWDLSFKP